MANQPNSKLKLLFLLQILQDKTDEEHGLSTQEIIEALGTIEYVSHIEEITG